MRQKLPMIFMTMAVVLALFAAVMTHRIVSDKIKKAARPVTIPVVVSVEDIDAGMPIPSTSLAIQLWPLTSLPNGCFHKISEVADSLAHNPILKNQAILKTNLETKDTTWGLSSMVSKGMRAMTINVDEVIGVAGFLQPDDRVDVFATVEKGREFMENPASSIVLHNVRILAIGEKVKEEPVTDNKKQKKNTKPDKVKVVTLEVDADKARYIAIVSSQCKLHLALRNPKDSVGLTQDKDGVLLSSVFQPGSWEVEKIKQKAKPKIKKPKPIYIEIIKGSQRSRVIAGSIP